MSRSLYIPIVWFTFVIVIIIIIIIIIAFNWATSASVNMATFTNSQTID